MVFLSLVILFHILFVAAACNIKEYDCIQEYEHLTCNWIDCDMFRPMHTVTSMTLNGPVSGRIDLRNLQVQHVDIRSAAINPFRALCSYIVITKPVEVNDEVCRPHTLIETTSTRTSRTTTSFSKRTMKTTRTSRTTTSSSKRTMRTTSASTATTSSSTGIMRTTTVSTGATILSSTRTTKSSPTNTITSQTTTFPATGPTTDPPTDPPTLADVQRTEDVNVHFHITVIFIIEGVTLFGVLVVILRYLMLYIRRKLRHHVPIATPPLSPVSTTITSIDSPSYRPVFIDSPGSDTTITAPSPLSQGDTSTECFSVSTGGDSLEMEDLDCVGRRTRSNTVVKSLFTKQT